MLKWESLDNDLKMFPAALEIVAISFFLSFLFFLFFPSRPSSRPLLSVLGFQDRASLCIPGSPGTCPVEQASLELRDPSGLPPECWD